MAFRTEPLVLSAAEHEELQQMSVSRTLPAGDVFRARLILMLAAGRTYAEVQQRLNTVRAGEEWSHFSRRKPESMRRQTSRLAGTR